MTYDVKKVLFGFLVFLRRQSKSEEWSLFRLHISADLLGNKRSWFVICDWWNLDSNVPIRFHPPICVFLLDLINGITGDIKNQP